MSAAEVVTRASRFCTGTEAAPFAFIPDTLASNALNTAFTTQMNANGAASVPVQNLDARVTTTAADTLTIYTESFSLNSQL